MGMLAWWAVSVAVLGLAAFGMVQIIRALGPLLR